MKPLLFVTMTEFGLLFHPKSPIASSKPCSLLIPQQWRINRQIKQRDVIRQCIVEDSGNNVRCETGQIDHPADVTVVDLFSGTNFRKVPNLA